MAEKGFSLVPLKIYFKGRHIKVEIGLGKGKSTLISVNHLSKKMLKDK